MAFKAVFFCALVIMVQVINGQRCRSSPCRSPPPSCNPSCVSISVSDNGGPLAVTSIGPISPSGIAVATDLGLSGDLAISGELPYLSAVAFEGQFDTSGSTPLSYGCGDCVAITQEIGNPSGSNAAVGSSLSTVNTCLCRRS